MHTLHKTPTKMSNRQILEQFKPLRENLLMILHALQDGSPNNYLSEEALAETAQYLKLTKSSVYGVATYYTMFSLKPRGKYIIRVCASMVCDLMEGPEILGHLEYLLGIKPGETTPCSTFSLEIAECLGQCHNAPALMINQQVFGGLNKDKITQIISQYRQ